MPLEGRGPIIRCEAEFFDAHKRPIGKYELHAEHLNGKMSPIVDGAVFMRVTVTLMEDK